MDRRDFLRNTIGRGIVAGAAVTLGNYSTLFAMNKNGSPRAYDLVAVKGGQPDVMFDRAIESLGGMKKYVAKGQKVLVKPNIGWDVVPENGANTDPRLVKRIIEHCYNAGAKQVFVFDHTCDNWKQAYKNSGIEYAAKSADATMVSGESESYYHEVNVPAGKILTHTKVHELLLEADVFFNVPILKHHTSTKLTIGMKNLMGVVWDRRFWHRNDLHRCVADFATYRKPDLTIVDAYYVMKRNGPRGTSKEDVLQMKSLILSTDMLAADVAATRLFGIEPDDIPYIQMADEMKVGTKDLSALSIKRIKL